MRDRQLSVGLKTGFVLPACGNFPLFKPTMNGHRVNPEKPGYLGLGSEVLEKVFWCHAVILRYALV